MKISQIGEFGLIDLIKKKVSAKDRRVLVNLGDDTAVLKSSPGRFLIFTTDTFVERVHFDLRYFNFEEVGWKAMAANLSDVAAMGGLPTYALVTVGLPKSMQSEDVLSIYKGASQIARKHECRIVGGDTTLVPKDLFISIALLGEVEKRFLVTRSGAKRGDLICVTGRLGEAQASLEYLRKYGRKQLSLVKKHLKPQPRINQSRTLVENLKINSMIDISDGLCSELLHISEESRLGALIFEQDIPISPKCRKLAPLLGGSPLSWALSSGEEYELLFTVDKKDVAKLKELKRRVNFSNIGQMVDRRRGIKMVGKSGKKKELGQMGFTHF
jgi:thiamine-monophosphate kinase